MKKIIPFVAAMAPFAVVASVPVVGNVSMVQDEIRKVAIEYDLSGGPAVVTADIQTNAPGGAWVSITAEVGATNFVGDVWRRVDSAHGVIRWNPVESWPDVKLSGGAGIRAVVTAWAPDDTPDYMVVDLAADSTCRTNYYPSVDLLPGGLFGNDDYRTTKLVMRKVVAKDVPWTMGSTCEPHSLNTSNYNLGVVPDQKQAHPVTLTNNYYLAVFETTHAQWRAITGSLPDLNGPYRFDTDGDMRPCESVYPSGVRGAMNWPSAPSAGSFLGRLRTRTGIDFDFPSEAQWEFACRAGSVDGEWNDCTRFEFTTLWNAKFVNSASSTQTLHTAVSADGRGRYAVNGGYIASDSASGSPFTAPSVTTCGLANGTVAAGTVYPPNAWGFYDMHGDVAEICLDHYAADITAQGGSVQTEGNNIVVRGGGWRSTSAFEMLSSTRMNIADNQWQYHIGFRLACRAGLR